MHLTTAEYSETHASYRGSYSFSHIQISTGKLHSIDLKSRRLIQTFEKYLYPSTHNTIPYPDLDMFILFYFFTSFEVTQLKILAGICLKFLEIMPCYRLLLGDYSLSLFQKESVSLGTAVEQFASLFRQHV